MRRLTGFTLAFLVAGCATTAFQYRFTPITADIQHYPDASGAIQVGVVPQSAGLALVIENQSEQLIRILWDRCVYVDTAGMSHRLIHSGIRLMDKEQAQAPGVVAPKSRLTDTLIPSDSIEWGYQSWVQRPLFPVDQWDALQLGQPTQYVGKEFSVMVALEINGQPVDRTFRFKVEGPPPPITPAK